MQLTLIPSFLTPEILHAFCLVVKC